MLSLKPDQEEVEEAPSAVPQKAGTVAIPARAGTVGTAKEVIAAKAAPASPKVTEAAEEAHAEGTAGLQGVKKPKWAVQSTASERAKSSGAIPLLAANLREGG